MIKVAVAILVVAIIWFVMKLRKASKPKVIVTAMPQTEPVGYLPDYPLDNPYDDYAELDAEPRVTEAPVVAKEGYADWGAEDAQDVEETYTEYSNPNFKSDLLED